MLQHSTKRDLQAGLQAAQRRWLDEAREFTKRTHPPEGLTLTEISRLAKISSSALTRFRNSTGYKGVLAPLTIKQVSQATGYPIKPEAVGAEGERLLAFKEAEGVPYLLEPRDPMSAAIEAFIDGRNGIDPWVLKTRALEYAGLRPGDVLLVDLNAEPRPGDVVCAQYYDFPQRRAETVFRLFEPPFLIATGPDDAARAPRFASDGSIAIKGVMLTSFRPRMARGA